MISCLNYFDILTKILWHTTFMLRQGHDSAPGLDIMLLKQQFLSVSGQAANPARQHPPVEYWLSGLQITMLKSWTCLPDLTRHNPGVQRHSIEFCRHASSLTGRETTLTPFRQLSSSRICIAGLCAPVVTHSIWKTIDFGEEMSRCVHIHGICNVYNMYMLVISYVYTWPELILLTAGLFGNYPSSSILHWRAWRRLWRCWITFWSRQYVVCASPAVLPLYAASHRC